MVALNNATVHLMKSQNIFWSEGQISRDQRWIRNGHKGCVVWLTGLSGSGKSTLSRGLECELFPQRRRSSSMATTCGTALEPRLFARGPGRISAARRWEHCSRR
jgi:adenylylsulfate kinase-like enzyme